jgi:hypothetical protein
MSESFEKILHDEDGLEITFIVENDEARVEVKAPEGMDLKSTEDVIVVVNGQGCVVVPRDSQFAMAKLGAWPAVSADPVQLMIRVHEFFEGWELE